MSEEIKVSISELDAKISDLKQMRDDWSAGDTACQGARPGKSGCGNALNAAELAADEYAAINSALASLLDLTIQYFENARKSLAASDENAAAAMK